MRGASRVHIRCCGIPLFAWLGIRPSMGQHTVEEHKALKKWATGRSKLVEIGVAEGASAVALREVMRPSLWISVVDGPIPP